MAVQRTRRHSSRDFIGALFLGLVAADGTGVEAPTLLPGSLMPRIEGESLSGKQIIMPEAVRGRPGVLVIHIQSKGGHAAIAGRKLGTTSRSEVGVCSTGFLCSRASHESSEAQ